MRALDVISLVAIVGAIFSVPAVLFSIPYLISDSKKGRKVISIGLIVFIVSIAIEMAAASTSVDLGHREILRKLAAMDSQSQVFINAQPVQNPAEILGILKNID